MDWWGRVKENISEGYTNFDNATGGYLPGGAVPNPTSFAGNLRNDAIKAVLPGGSVGKVADKGGKATKSGAGHTAAGRPDLAATAHGASTIGSTLRAGAVDRVVDKGTGWAAKQGAKRLLQKHGAKLIPGVGQGIALYDTASDIRSGYSSVLEATTGKDLDGHLGTAGRIRDEESSLSRVLPSAEFVPANTESGVAEITQGSRENPLWQEAKARASMFLDNFDPVTGDWGVTELVSGNSTRPNKLDKSKAFPGGMVGAGTW